MVTGDEMIFGILRTVCVGVAGLALVAQASTQAKLLPSPSGEGINRGQPFDRKVVDPAVYAGNVYFIWGSQKPENDAPAVGSKYQPYSRDPDRSHTLAWYRQNHPDWVEYQADRKTPAFGYIYARGNAMLIDVTNPSVREWYWATYIGPSIQAGYPIFAFDNVNLENGEKRAGHFNAKGNWVQQFSGQRDDDAYALAVVDWMQYLCTRLHAVGIGVAANITFPLGKPKLEPAMRKLVEMVDIWGDEQGFTLHRDVEVSDDRWQQKFDFVRSVETQRIHWAINETTTAHLADASQQQIDWAVANYYLYREKDSLLTLSGSQEYGVFLDTPAMHVNLGGPAGPPMHDGSGAWLRRYSRGMVAVNPSSKQVAVVKLPPGTWVNNHGNEYDERMALQPISGAMLIKK